jgi:hypothetical protein
MDRDLLPFLVIALALLAVALTLAALAAPADAATLDASAECDTAVIDPATGTTRGTVAVPDGRRTVDGVRPARRTSRRPTSAPGRTT